jgi:glycosyltransferase involved in cell wall biosynthesis
MVKMVHVRVNEGYGWGIINGLLQASGDFAGHMCGDGQIRPDDMMRVIQRLEQHPDSIAKVRRITRHDGAMRKFLSSGYNTLFRIMFGVRCMDINGSPKFLRRTIIEKMELISKDWFIDAEVMIKAGILGLEIEELPVEFLRRERGRSHVAFTTIFEFLNNMAAYRFGKRTREWKRRTLRS